jgi:hypothetical protein
MVPPPAELASTIAWRSEPAPPSAVVVTVTVPAACASIAHAAAASSAEALGAIPRVL